MAIRTKPKGRIIVERRKPSWHFDKKLSLDTLVAIAGIALVIGGPLIIAWRTMETRLLTVELAAESQQKQFMQQLTDMREQRAIFSLSLKELGDNMTSLRIDVAKIIAAQQAAQQSTRLQDGGRK